MTAPHEDDRGQSLVEAVVLGLALFVPLVAAVVLSVGLHRATLAADAAAREAARAWSTSPTVSEAPGRAQGAAGRAVEDHGFGAGDVEVRVEGVLRPGAEATVVARVPVPLLSRVLSVRREAEVDVDRLRSTEDSR